MGKRNRRWLKDGERRSVTTRLFSVDMWTTVFYVFNNVGDHALTSVPLTRKGAWGLENKKRVKI